MGGSVIPRRVCVRTIHQIFRDKIEGDNQDDGTGVKRQPFTTFLYEWYLNKYGLRRLAEQQITKMLTSITRYRKQSMCCCKFGQFLGMFDPLSADVFNVYLDFFSVILSLTQGQSFESANRGQEDPEAQMVSVTGAVNAALSLFGERMGMQSADLRLFNSAIDAIGVPDPKRGNTKFVERVS